MFGSRGTHKHCQKLRAERGLTDALTALPDNPERSHGEAARAAEGQGESATSSLKWLKPVPSGKACSIQPASEEQQDETIGHTVHRDLALPSFCSYFQSRQEQHIHYIVPPSN